MLCFFNLLPIPPFDGSRLYTSFIDQSRVKTHGVIEGVGFTLVIFLLSYDKTSKYFLYLLEYVAEVMEKL